MTLLTKVVLYEDGERRSLPSFRKLSAEYRTVYVAKRLNEEERKVIEDYYLSKSARLRLHERSRIPLPLPRVKRAKRILGLLDDYEKSGICIPWKVWWQDRGDPKHPFSVIQQHAFRVRAAIGAMDITGGLMFWVSESGRARNEVLHETVEDILNAYLNDTMPMHRRIIRGELTGEMSRNVITEIERRADEAVGAIVIACAIYGMSDDSPKFRSNQVALGEAEARQVSA